VVAYLGVLHGTETLYIAKTESRHLPIVIEVGVRLPAALTASGRAMLAALSVEQVRADFSTPRAWVDRTGRGPTDWAALRALLEVERERGWSEEDGFITEGFASVAAPVRNHLHRPVAAIGVTFVSADTTPAMRNSLANKSLRTAQQLSRRLGER
jgi:DNA-binding IclR family transcriptional regulator